MRRTSVRRRAQFQERAAVRDAVFARDGHRCRLYGIPDAGPCWGPHDYHHILKAAQGGRYTVENGACLCRHHNDLIEADADLAALARSLGLVRRSWE